MSDIIKTQRSLARKALYQPMHRFDHLYRIICQEEWISTAITRVLANKGARTAGIDGVTRKTLRTKATGAVFLQEVREELREQRFQPEPVRRVFIPKAQGKVRPLGIPTLKDRVVQMLVKMALEPIWESDFLACSNGFRPGRRTMDCIARLDSYINNQSKYYWIIEGDIKGAFDNIHHGILLKVLAERIADARLLDLVDRFLKAGVMEGTLFRRSEVGTPQGGICSPLLANIYLHQLDLYWWKRYGSLLPRDKGRRRAAHQGNCALIRYADDWLLLTNGDKAEAYRLRQEFQAFLAEELKLTLAVEKTHVTHVNEGFDFLGFHIRRYVRPGSRPKMLVMPNDKAQRQLKAKIKEMTDRKRAGDAPLLKLSALNLVLRGWIAYFRHCNAKEIAHELDFWVSDRVFRWLKKRQRLGQREVLAQYKRYQNGTRHNWGVWTGEKCLFLYRMSDQPITKYRSRTIPNPYLSGTWDTTCAPAEAPLSEEVWMGNSDQARWRVHKAEVKAERGVQCENCGSPVALDLHHLIAPREGGQDTKANAQLLCRRCHVQTPTYGLNTRRQ